MLRPSEQPLSSAYDLAVLDLDGVVYVGGTAVDHAADVLDRTRSAGLQVAFVTNNAARTPMSVAEHLAELGIRAEPGDVVTSAQAAAGLLARQLDPGASVFVIGDDGLSWAVRERGLVPVTEAAEHIAAVVQGYGPQMPWRRVVDGALLVRAGLPWVATNMDLTLPTPRGPGPGNGTLVELVATYAGRSPQVAGKPEPALFEETVERVGGEHPLVVGDRLDTDIAGATRVGWDSLLVLTGVTGLPELVGAGTDGRPTFLGSDLRSLERAHGVPEHAEGAWRLGGWSASVADRKLTVSGAGEVDDWWRVVAVAAWEQLDRGTGPVETGDLRPPGSASR
ncbi:HAD-IIA family hydrolase [Nocardioides terrisoli]|uniref:HAD-IIA family hydrolase n=1 Tax=Nocardioides terrisoli TaxID=3388267 RepID=UPI00287B9B4E|nr:HAD-IIA family hydrolase [Nocardioides marmorisolisilvae]